MHCRNVPSKLFLNWRECLGGDPPDPPFFYRVGGGGKKSSGLRQFARGPFWRKSMRAEGLHFRQQKFETCNYIFAEGCPIFCRHVFFGYRSGHLVSFFCRHVFFLAPTRTFFVTGGSFCRHVFSTFLTGKFSHRLIFLSIFCDGCQSVSRH